MKRSRFGRQLARLSKAGTATTVVHEIDDAPTPAPAPEAAPAAAPPRARDPFASLRRRPTTGRGWDLDDSGDSSDAASGASDMTSTQVDVPTEASAPAEAQDGPADEARKARIAKLRARLDAMVGRRRTSLAEKPPTPRISGPWGRRLAEMDDEEAVEPTRPRRAPDDFSGVPGALEETDFGAIHVVSQTYDPDHCHGRAPVGRALTVPGAEVARLALDPELCDVDLSTALFLDTETTGLYGSGTVPFLIGVAWFEDGALELRQLFLRRLGEERPMLEWLSDRLDRSEWVISYNGKSFDWPLIRQRYVMNRLPPPPDPLHFDLLHCARRAYKKRLGTARLVEIESRVLGMDRIDDTPGSEIPAIYLDFVRGGPADRIAGIIEHNAHDLVAMAALLGHLGERFAKAWHQDDPRDLVSYARIALRAGEEERAREFARVAAERGTGAWACDAWLLHARLARRRGDVDEEQRALEAAVAEAADDEQRGEAHLALAKLFEHKRKDFDQALRHAYQTRWIEGTEKWQRRIARVEEKRARIARVTAD